MIRTEADIAAALDALLSADARLVAILKAAGTVPLRRSRAGLEGLIAIIVAQQVAKASADAIFGRLATAVDLRDPDAILAADEETLRGAGLSRPKYATIRTLASAIAEGQVDLQRCENAPAEAAIAELVALRGIGIWTAECYLLFCAGHRDIFPAGDLALQAAVGHALEHESRPSAKTVATIAETWRPHRSVAARLFWAYYAAIHSREVVPAADAIKPSTPQISTAKAGRAKRKPRPSAAKSLS
ncbi:DNA-3-methyladenine glycosylase 2 family protein [Jiella sp. MQZ9-1]|uniref:DNA-3-methyladenine glycosylase II n=2 Tax=Jiella flava TaxID=2816857 RepID=A0A939G141_9HYPH|nr:DNA-3-methyladenine glycosylase 2 family protein [Jiella flava]MBO0663628.1 DNA-3-methyladenine glycosylase 2 family protein [Jiella flava]MCD2472203.1 DNA-3-methyladenine glycosylase 2 family protein [Jiella flava]